MVSRSGFKIGSVFVIDDRARASPNKTELEFLGVMASNIMNYLDMQKECRQQQRHMTMSRGLAALVEGKSRIPSAWINNSTLGTKTSRAHAESIDSPTLKDGKRPGEHNIHLNDAIPAQQKGSAVTRSVFPRASNLLRESLDVDYVVFLDAGEDNSTGAGSKRVSVVGFSSNEESTVSNRAPTYDCAIEQKFLKVLYRQYPLGKIWSYHEDGTCDYYDDEPMDLTRDEVPSTSPTGSDSEDTESENEILGRCFPGARQILYAPLWNNGNPDHVAACFAVSKREVPVFTTEIEVAFVRAFVNSTGVICGHLAATLGEQQKGEFISSMSHVRNCPIESRLISPNSPSHRSYDHLFMAS